MPAELLDQPRLSMLGRSSDPELQRISSTVTRAIPIEGRAELESVLCRLLGYGVPGRPKTLDLIGHSTTNTSLLMLGDWVIDASSPIVTAFFRELADQNVLPRLGVHAVRLLGCTTAETAHGQWTICALADILGVDVYGTTGPLLASHYNGNGFADERSYLLVSAPQLRSRTEIAKPLDHGRPGAYTLDIDTLPPEPLDAPRRWPVHVVSPEEARELLCLVRRREGSTMPSLTVPPSCELALPSTAAGRYHRLQVLLDGELVRVHPAGAADGVVYPVSDPETFRTLVGYLTRR